MVFERSGGHSALGFEVGSSQVLTRCRGTGGPLHVLTRTSVQLLKLMLWSVVYADFQRRIVAELIPTGHSNGFMEVDLGTGTTGMSGMSRKTFRLCVRRPSSFLPWVHRPRGEQSCILTFIRAQLHQEQVVCTDSQLFVHQTEAVWLTGSFTGLSY